MKYRKKPVVINAFQMTKERRWDKTEWPTWLAEAWNKKPGESGCLYSVDENGLAGTGVTLCITTLEGTHTVTFDDYIIQGIHGELCPCKPDIFEKTYERVE